MSLKLIPMTEREYRSYRRESDESYFAARSAADGISLEASREKFSKQIQTILPGGFHTPGHAFCFVKNEQGLVVGDIWFFLKESEAYLYDIRIQEEQRRKGYGRMAMQALETEVKARGGQSILLNVFGYNTAAQELYRSCGYHVASMHMRKRIGT